MIKTFAVIRAYPWDWWGFSENRSISLDAMLMIDAAFIGDKWSWGCLSFNHSVTCDILERYIDEPWNWKWISANPNITWKFIQEHMDKKWDWQTLSRHPAITWEIVQSNPVDANGDLIPWDFRWMSSHPKMLDVILANPDNPWNWAAVSENPALTIDIVRESMGTYLWEVWDWWNLSRLPGIGKFVAELYDAVGINNFTSIDVAKYIIRKWSWLLISANPTTDISVVKTIATKGRWHWNSLSANPAIFWHDMRDNPSFPWNIEGICKNPNLTWQNIEQLNAEITLKDQTFVRATGGVDWHAVSTNLFNQHPVVQRRLAELAEVEGGVPLPAVLVNIIIEFLSA